VDEKLQSWEVNADIRQKIIARLKEEKFLDEERYARMYAIGKHRNNKWGRQKIRVGLKEKKVSIAIAESAINSLDTDEYEASLLYLIEKKQRKTKANSVFELRKKIAASLMQKGYEAELVWDMLKEKIQ
jgi:regulatory protein